MRKALISRLDRWLSANRPDYYAHLLPGVSDDQLNTFEVQFSLELPAAFQRLYRGRNGHDQFQSQSLVRNLENGCSTGRHDSHSGPDSIS